MALNRTQKYMVLAGFALIIAILASAQFISISNNIETAPVISEKRDADQMTGGYAMVKPTATQNDVIGIMGSQYGVLKCPADAPPTCAHVYHYEGGGQAWEFTFDMDGNLMKKEIVTAGGQ